LKSSLRGLFNKRVCYSLAADESTNTNSQMRLFAHDTTSNFEVFGELLKPPFNAGLERGIKIYSSITIWTLIRDNFETM